MAGTGSSRLGRRRSLQLARRFAHWLVPIIYLVSGVAFLSDIFRNDTLAYGIIYTPLIATAVVHEKRSGLWILSTVACLMVVAGAFLPAVNPDLPDLIGNRILSILAILATAAFVHHARDIQDRLAAETRRAEEAERIKTDILTNVSQEIRMPFHALLGVLSLTMATSKPAQKEALGRIRNDGKQLLATIDNLLDLVQIEERQPQLQTIDVKTIARDAIEGARPAAIDRQISLGPPADGETPNPAAIGDPWATRRILDNLLANAVRLTPPGGHVSISVTRTGGTVTVSVTDTGTGMPPMLAEDAHDERGALPASGGVGLALSRRLAQAMNGRLTASNTPGPGATVSLSLPTDPRSPERPRV